MYCGSCGVRWGVDEGSHCSMPGGTPSGDDSKDQIWLAVAKCIIGPLDDRFIGRGMLLKLRDHKWDKAKNAEKLEAENIAKAILKELDA